MLKSIIIDKDGVVHDFHVPYSEYFNRMSQKDKKDELKKIEESCDTFKIFSTGFIVMSSQGPEMKNVNCRFTFNNFLINALPTSFLLVWTYKFN
jgi:hypothetical protein